MNGMKRHLRIGISIFMLIILTVTALASHTEASANYYGQGVNPGSGSAAHLDATRLDCKLRLGADVYAKRLVSGGELDRINELTKQMANNSNAWLIAEVACNSERLTVEFRTDDSCIYQPDSFTRSYFAIRGYVTATLHVPMSELTWDELLLVEMLGFEYFWEFDVPYTHPVDVHLYLGGNSPVSIRNVVELTK